VSDNKRTTLLTPKGVLSYPNLFHPASMEEGGEKKFSCTLLFSPEAMETPQFAALKAAAAAAAKEKWASGLPSSLRNPFRQAVEKDGYKEKFTGWMFINISSKQRPGIVRIDGNGTVPIIDENEIYPGCVVIASVGAYAYDQRGNRGVAFGLNNILKVADGERIAGRPSADSDFAAFVQANPAAAGKPAEDIFGGGGASVGGLL
jgi:hypothetical protein